MNIITSRQFNRVIDLVCEKMDVNRKNVIKKRRWKETVEARFVIWRVLKIHYGLSNGEIARLFSTDPSTVLKGHAAYYRRATNDPTLILVYQTVIYLLCQGENHPLFLRPVGGVRIYGIEVMA